MMTRLTTISRLASLSLLAATLAQGQNGPNGSTMPKEGPHVEVAVARKKLRDDMPRQIGEFMKLHNDARAEVGVPPLVWDDLKATARAANASTIVLGSWSGLERETGRFLRIEMPWSPRRALPS